LIKKLQTQAEKIHSSPIYPFLDYPELLFIDSLLQNPPYLYQEAFEEKSSHLQPITTIKELALIESRLTQVNSLQELFSVKLPFELPEPNPEEDGPLPLSGIFLTAVANQILERNFDPSPLTIEDFPLLRSKTFIDDQISEPFCEEICASMDQLAPECDFFVHFCLDIWEQIFQDLEPMTDQSPVFSTLLVTREDD